MCKTPMKPGSGNNTLVVGLKQGIGDREQIDLFMQRCRRNYPGTVFLTAGYVFTENIITIPVRVIFKKQKSIHL